MSKWTGSWLSGPRAALGPDAETAQDYRGQRLGLPESGPGSVAGFGKRALALLIDWLPCAFIAQAFTKNPGISALAIFAAYTVLAITISGRSLGHAALGLRLAMIKDRKVVDGRPSFGDAVVRTVLLCLVIPPVVYDKDGRGLHDRAVGTLVVQAR